MSSSTQNISTTQKVWHQNLKLEIIRVFRERKQFEYRHESELSNFAEIFETLRYFCLTKKQTIVKKKHFQRWQMETF